MRGGLTTWTVPAHFVTDPWSKIRRSQLLLSIVSIVRYTWCHTKNNYHRYHEGRLVRSMGRLYLESTRHVARLVTDHHRSLQAELSSLDRNEFRIFCSAGLRVGEAWFHSNTHPCISLPVKPTLVNQKLILSSRREKKVSPSRIFPSKKKTAK